MKITNKVLAFAKDAYSALTFHGETRGYYRHISADGKMIEYIMFKEDVVHGDWSVYDCGIYLCTFSEDLLKTL